MSGLKFAFAYGMLNHALALPGAAPDNKYPFSGGYAALELAKLMPEEKEMILAIVLVAATQNVSSMYVTSSAFYDGETLETLQNMYGDAVMDIVREVMAALCNPDADIEAMAWEAKCALVAILLDKYDTLSRTMARGASPAVLREAATYFRRMVPTNACLALEERCMGNVVLLEAQAAEAEGRWRQWDEIRAFFSPGK